MDKPEADYYLDLGITQSATAQQIKKAYHRLAIVHHPDKKAPGENIDAAEFRKIHDAYECLSDAMRRAQYDRKYVLIQRRWAQYRRWEKAQSRAQEQRRANEAMKRRLDERAKEEEAKKREENAEKLRKLDEIWQTIDAQRKKRQQEAQRARPGEETRQANAEEEAQRPSAKETKQAREEEARRATEEEAQRPKPRPEETRRAREEEKARRDKEEEARWERAERAEKEARRARFQQEADAARQQNASALTPCVHAHIGKVWWKNGPADCSFCSESGTYCFRCPVCDVAACQDCRGDIAV